MDDNLPTLHHAIGHQQLVLHDLHDLVAGLCATLGRTNGSDGLGGGGDIVRGDM